MHIKNKCILLLVIFFTNLFGAHFAHAQVSRNDDDKELCDKNPEQPNCEHINNSTKRHKKIERPSYVDELNKKISRSSSHDMKYKNDVNTEFYFNENEMRHRKLVSDKFGKAMTNELNRMDKFKSSDYGPKNKNKKFYGIGFSLKIDNNSDK